MSKATIPHEYSSVLEELKAKIKAAQAQAMIAVNRELINKNWPAI